MPSSLFFLLFLLLCVQLPGSDAGLFSKLPGLGFSRKFKHHEPSSATNFNCTESFFTQTIDHFGFQSPPLGSQTYQQRYFICSQFWTPFQGKPGPIFFYAGNEADVTLYVNHTGLMWENAESFGALLIFAEHRYFGKSMPFGPKTMDYLNYFSHEQAMADYVNLLYNTKISLNCTLSPVVTFGGSYGGMLSAWLRLKYPGTFVGAIAASAPIFAFQGEFPDYDSELYWQVVTRDASPAGGSSSECVPNVKNAWPLIFELGSNSSGRQTLTEIFHLCQPLQTDHDVQMLALLLKFAFDNMAMGDYPYPSDYITGGMGFMPAFPMRAACEFLNTPLSGLALLEAMNLATGVYNNATQTETCYPIPTDPEEDGIWDYLFCTEMLPQETYFTCNSSLDMFWDEPFNMTFIQERCQSEYNVQPRPDWIAMSYGERSLAGASNIVFSNGNLDPWSSGGVTESFGSVYIATVEDGAHHLDLFFSNPQDPPSVTQVRQFEMQCARAWIDEHYAKLLA